MNTKFLTKSMIAASLLTFGVTAGDDEARAVVANPASPVIEQMAELSLPFLKVKDGKYEPDYDSCIVSDYEEGNALLRQLDDIVKHNKLDNLHALKDAYSRLALYIVSSEGLRNKFLTTAFCKVAASIIPERS